jgi:hypothetical protein
MKGYHEMQSFRSRENIKFDFIYMKINCLRIIDKSEAAVSFPRSHFERSYIETFRMFSMTYEECH